MNQHLEFVIFQDLGSSPASMEAGKVADCYGCAPGHAQQQVDAEHAHIQARLEGAEACVNLASEVFNVHKGKFYHPDGPLKHARPCDRFINALLGDFDAGIRWERPSCDFYGIFELFLMVCVDDFKYLGPKHHFRERV